METEEIEMSQLIPIFEIEKDNSADAFIEVHIPETY